MSSATMTSQPSATPIKLPFAQVGRLLIPILNPAQEPEIVSKFLENFIETIRAQKCINVIIHRISGGQTLFMNAHVFLFRTNNTLMHRAISLWMHREVTSPIQITVNMWKLLDHHEKLAWETLSQKLGPIFRELAKFSTILEVAQIQLRWVKVEIAKLCNGLCNTNQAAKNPQPPVERSD